MEKEEPTAPRTGWLERLNRALDHIGTAHLRSLWDENNHIRFPLFIPEDHRPESPSEIEHGEQYLEPDEHPFAGNVGQAVERPFPQCGLLRSEGGSDRVECGFNKQSVAYILTHN